MLIIPTDTVDTRCLDHVKANHGVIVHNNRVIRLDESHAAHISCEVENMVDTFGDGKAVIHDAEIYEVELVAEHVIIHVLVLLPIRGDDVVAFALEAAGDVGGDEATGTGDGDAQRGRGPIGFGVELAEGVIAIDGRGGRCFSNSIGCHNRCRGLG